MPLTLQSNSGSFVGTSGDATLAATTAGTTVIIVVATNGSGSVTGVTGCVSDGPNPTNPRAYLWRKSNVGAGETTWTISVNFSQPVAWWAHEVDGLDLSAPLDVKPATYSFSASASSLSTGTTPTSTVYDGYVLAVHVAWNSATSTIPTWSGQTNSFEEVADVGLSSGSTALGMAVSRLYTQQLNAFTCTATASATLALGATVVVYAAAGTKRASLIDVMSGFEIATTAGLTTGATGGPPFDTQAGNPAIINSGRDGGWCLECSSTAAAENVLWTSALSAFPPSAPTVGVMRVCIYFPTSLPSGDVDLFSIEASNLAFVRFRSASSKIGVTSGTGSEVLSDATVAANTWIGIDIRANSATTTWTLDWQVDYNTEDATLPVVQTQATSTGTAGVAYSGVRLGWNTSATATVRYDDVIYSKIAGQYPLGDHRIFPLKVDPAGTLTISGTTANFNTYTNNGTMTAWNATTARGAVNDIPPTIGGTADGIAQVTAAASDYVEIPMETYDAPANGGQARAVRWYFCGWAASGTAATIGFRSFDGTTEMTLFPAADPSFDNATVDPAWVCRMHRTPGSATPPLLTQAKVNGLAARVGFSGDATPDIGIHAVLAEVAVLKTDPVQSMFGVSGDVTTTVQRAPDSAGIVTMTTTTPVGKGTALHYEVNTSPTDAAVAANSTRNDTVDAADAPTVNYVAIYPDAEPVLDT